MTARFGWVATALCCAALLISSAGARAGCRVGRGHGADRHASELLPRAVPQRIVSPHGSDLPVSCGASCGSDFGAAARRSPAWRSYLPMEGHARTRSTICIEQTKTTGFLVIKDGKIVQERYFAGASETSTFTSMSVAKSFTSTLVGLALADGKIKSLDDPITDYVPELKGHRLRRRADQGDPPDVLGREVQREVCVGPLLGHGLDVRARDDQ